MSQCHKIFSDNDNMKRFYTVIFTLRFYLRQINTDFIGDRDIA